MNEIILFTEGHECTLQEFIHINTAPDVDPMSQADILNLFSLKVGESTMSGMLTVKRVK